MLGVIAKLKKIFTSRWFKLSIVMIVVVVLVSISATCSRAKKSVKRLTEQVGEQSETINQQQIEIDSLYRYKDSQAIYVTMTIEDNSKNVVKGSRNKGTIEMPSNRTYSVKLDSVVFKGADRNNK